MRNSDRPIAGGRSKPCSPGWLKPDRGPAMVRRVPVFPVDGTTTECSSGRTWGARAGPLPVPSAKPGRRRRLPGGWARRARCTRVTGQEHTRWKGAEVDHDGRAAFPRACRTKRVEVQDRPETRSLSGRRLISSNVAPPVRWTGRPEGRPATEGPGSGPRWQSQGMYGGDDQAAPTPEWTTCRRTGRAKEARLLGSFDAQEFAEIAGGTCFVARWQAGGGPNRSAWPTGRRAAGAERPPAGGSRAGAGTGPAGARFSGIGWRTSTRTRVTFAGQARGRPSRLMVSCTVRHSIRLARKPFLAVVRAATGP